jgi:hypothetical protein
MLDQTMNKPDLDKATREELIVYIEYQDKILNGATKLQAALAETCDVLANDLTLINEGKTEGLKILNSDEKYFERINLMVKNKSDWANLSIKPIEKAETAIENGKKKVNVQDFVIKKVV